MPVFQGAGVALITPFQEDKSIDYEKLECMVERQIKGKTDAIIVCGTTGEPATMTAEEHTEVIRFVIAKTAHRIPVIVGTGANCTQTAVDLTMQAEKLGADGVLVVTPYYNKATQEGLLAHYKAVADSVTLPVIMYNVPGRTGCNILPETAARIAEASKNIAGIKEASGDISQIAELSALTRGRLDLYSGNDDQIVPILALGGIGVISVLSNVAPEDTHDMVMEYLSGNTKRATELQLRYLGLIHALFSEVNPIPVKWAAHLMGYGAGNLRLPLTELSDPHKRILEAELRKLHLLKEYR